MNKLKIGFIGAGNMARALIGGLLASGIPADRISCYDPNHARLKSLQDDFTITPADSNQRLAETNDVVVLAVKPQAMHTVISELQALTRYPLFLSIAAGIRTSAFNTWFGRKDIPLVRAMPNTPALVQAGATGLYATAAVSKTQRDSAETIMRAVGITLWLKDEADLDAVTAVSGSGPAYFFYLMEAMEQAGTQLGLSTDAARLLTIQTAFGAAKLALEADEDPAELRQRVTSPGGTTERAIQHLEQAGTREIFVAALTAARDRSAELAQQLEQAS